MEMIKVNRFSREEIAEITEGVIEQLESDEKLALRLAWIITRVLVKDPDLGTTLIEALEDKFPQSVLSDEAVKRGMEKGYVVINPFKLDRLKTSSYDVCVGEYYFQTRPPHPGNRLFNPHDPDHIRRLWQGPFRAKTVREIISTGEYKDDLSEQDFRGLDIDDPVIIIPPGETVLAHSEEFIGGRDKITAMLKARSSWGRAFLSVCKDAGWGDVGYFNRWTMEIQNNLPYSWTVVPVHQPIAQMIFFRVNRSMVSGQYSSDGSYQNSNEIDTLRAQWRPEMMLPKLTRKDP